MLCGDLNRYTLTGCLPQRADPLPLALLFRTAPATRARDPQAGTEEAGITYRGTLLLRQTQVNEAERSSPVNGRRHCTICLRLHAEKVRQHDC